MQYAYSALVTPKMGVEFQGMAGINKHSPIFTSLSSPVIRNCLFNAQHPKLRSYSLRFTNKSIR